MMNQKEREDFNRLREMGDKLEALCKEYDVALLGSIHTREISRFFIHLDPSYSLVRNLKDENGKVVGIKMVPKSDDFEAIEHTMNMTRNLREGLQSLQGLAQEVEDRLTEAVTELGATVVKPEKGNKTRFNENGF